MKEIRIRFKDNYIDNTIKNYFITKHKALRGYLIRKILYEYIVSQNNYGKSKTSEKENPLKKQHYSEISTDKSNDLTEKDTKLLYESFNNPKNKPISDSGNTDDVERKIDDLLEKF